MLRVNVAEATGGKTVFGQLTVAGVTGGGFVTAYGCDDGIPKDSQGNINKADLNYDGNVAPIASNRLIVKADNDGDICFYTLAPAEMIIDINGITDTGVTAIPNQRTDTRIATTTTTTTTPSTTSTALLNQLTVAAQNTPVPYDRDDWQHWIDADGDCQDTRAEVLIRDSSASVTFTSSSDCTVKTGQWLDPWTSLEFSVASDVDIDHTVPLANAHQSGGWNFSAAQKRDFANDLANKNALRAIDDSTNSSKGSRGPESWKPTSTSSWCGYATDWASIKIRWNLTVNTAEYNALAEMLDTCDGTTTTPTTTTTTTTTTTAAPATTQPAPTTTAVPTTTQPPVPAEYRNPLQKAQSYLNFSAFSPPGLVAQLEYEQFSTEAAQWAVQNVGADWNVQAALKAGSYLDFSSFSEGGNPKTYKRTK